MLFYKIKIIFTGVILSIGTSYAQDNKDYPIQPVTFNHVHVNDQFWAPRIEVNATGWALCKFVARYWERQRKFQNFQTLYESQVQPPS